MQWIEKYKYHLNFLYVRCIQDSKINKATASAPKRHEFDYYQSRRNMKCKLLQFFLQPLKKSELSRQEIQIYQTFAKNYSK